MPGARRRPLRGDQRRQRVGRHRPHRDASPRRASSCAAGAELEADIIVTATGLNCCCSAACELAVDGDDGRPPRDDGLQGHDAQRRAEPGASRRLHERLVDAEGRPHRRVRLPAAQPHGRQRLPRRARRRPTTRRRRRSRSSTSTPATCCARSTTFPKQGSKRAVAPAPELRPDMMPLRLGASTTACCGSGPPTGPAAPATADAAAAPPDPGRPAARLAAWTGRAASHYAFERIGARPGRRPGRTHRR